MHSPWTRPRHLLICFVILFVPQAGIAFAYQNNEPFKNASTRPNIVVFFTDDQGIHDVGSYGSEIPTPNIDSLAQDGLKLTQFYAASAICTPSRFGLLTGMNPSRSKDQLLSALMFLEEEDKDRGIRKHEESIAAALGACGYETALIGKWHLGHGSKQFMPRQHGFDFTYGHTGGCIDFFTMRYGIQPDWYRNGQLIEETGYATDLITDEAVQFINSRDSEKPFFLFLPYNAPHFGKGRDDGKDQTVNLLQPHPRDLARVSSIEDITRRKFAAKVVALDDGIGRVLNAISAKQLEENTLVIFMTDHGGDPNYGGANLPFRGGKATLFEGGIRVPCLIRWKGVVENGTECNAPISALDLFPTLVELAGSTTITQPMDGRSLLKGLQTFSEREMFWELGAHSSLERGNWTALRLGHWKLVINPKQEKFLFNISKDPTEQHNLAEELPTRMKDLEERAQELSKVYRQYAKEK